MPKSSRSSNIDGPTADQFGGFLAPITTPVPDVIFDEIITEVENAEQRVLFYIVRRTAGFKKTKRGRLNQLESNGPRCYATGRCWIAEPDFPGIQSPARCEDCEAKELSKRSGPAMPSEATCRPSTDYERWSSQSKSSMVTIAQNRRESATIIGASVYLVNRCCRITTNDFRKLASVH